MCETRPGSLGAWGLPWQDGPAPKGPSSTLLGVGEMSRSQDHAATPGRLRPSWRLADWSPAGGSPAWVLNPLGHAELRQEAGCQPVSEL